LDRKENGRTGGRTRRAGSQRKVDLPFNDVRNDADISAAALTICRVPTHLVNVKVENSWITLSGEVDFKFQQIAAEG
jgi:osmotically-inducible protein OsmY